MNDLKMILSSQRRTWRMGFCEYQLGNIKNSIETFQSFKNQFKDSPLLFYTHYLLGKIFMMNGDHLSSIKELNLILNRHKEIFGEALPSLRFIGITFNWVNMKGPIEFSSDYKN